MKCFIRKESMGGQKKPLVKKNDVKTHQGFAKNCNIDQFVMWERYFVVKWNQDIAF